MGFLPYFDVYNAEYDLCILFVINFFIRRESHRVCTCMHCRAYYIYASLYVPTLSSSLSLPTSLPSSPLTVALHQCINWLVAGICCESSDNCYANGLHISTLVQRGRERGLLMSLMPRRTHGATINCAPQKAIRVQCEKRSWLRFWCWCWFWCWLHASSGHEGKVQWVEGGGGGWPIGRYLL